MTIEGKVENILGGLLERNKNYAIEAYIRNGITNNLITRLLVTTDRTVKRQKEKYLLEWRVNGLKEISCSLPYDEVMDCYEGKDEYGSQTVYVILKNGMKIEFECCGERM